MTADADLAIRIYAALLPILKRGNAAEIKLIGGELQIIEIQRKIKYRTTLTTG